MAKIKGDVSWYTNKGKKIAGSTRAVSDTIVVLLEEAVKDGYPNSPNGLLRYIDELHKYWLSDEERAILNAYVKEDEGDDFHNWRM